MYNNFIKICIYDKYQCAKAFQIFSVRLPHQNLYRIIIIINIKNYICVRKCKITTQRNIFSRLHENRTGNTLRWIAFSLCSSTCTTDYILTYDNEFYIMRTAGVFALHLALVLITKSIMRHHSTQHQKRGLISTPQQNIYYQSGVARRTICIFA